MLKYVNTGVVFQEIPDEVTLAINISNCPCRCPGCHSNYLWQNVGTPLSAMELNNLIRRYESSITCVAFMGGDSEPTYIDTLARFIRREHPKLKVAWYSGRQRIPSQVCRSDFDYIKLGPYIAHLGCLKERSTNQRLYKRVVGDSFTDITHLFWK
jgi:anaerobic ribonucleoside-triphosphate reductase activating protein